MAWQFVATDRAGTPLGEIRDCRNRGWRRSLNRGRSLRGSIRPQNSLASPVASGDTTLVKAYDDRTGAKILRHCGPITGSEKTVDERGQGAIGWASSDPTWRLLARLIGKSQAGASFGSAVVPVERGTTAGQIIDALNRGDFASVWCSQSDTGIRRGPGTLGGIVLLAPPTGLNAGDTPISSSPGRPVVGHYPPGFQATYVVTAFNANGDESAASASFTTAPNASPVQGIDITWNAVAGATKYRLYRVAISSGTDLGGAYDQVPAYVDNVSSGYTDFGVAWKDNPGGPGSVLAPPGYGYFGPWRYYPASAALGQLFTGLDSPDWDVLPTEPTADADGVQIGTMVAAAVLGSLRPSAVFEFGDGRKNVKGFSVTSDCGTVANDIAHLPSGFPDNATQAVIEKSNAESIAARGLREDALTDEVLTDALRDALVKDHLAVRRVPRRTIQFQLIRDPDPFHTPLEERRVPRPFVDFDVGDVVPFRATELCEVRDATTGLVTGYRQMKTVDALFRVFTIDITINDDDSEAIALTFVEEGS